MIELHKNETINSNPIISVDLGLTFNFDSYDNRLSSIIINYESFFTKVEKFNDQLIAISNHGILKSTSLLVYSIDFLANINQFIINKAVDLAMPLYVIARKSTPFTRLWLWYYKRMNEFVDNLFLIPGIHYIVALPGGGKSSIIYDITDEIRFKTGKSAYVNVEMEIPYLDQQRLAYTVNRRLFEVEEFFGIEYDPQKDKHLATQLKSFDTEHFNTIVMDEWLANNNHRQNKTNDYNNKVIPMITFFARMRHASIPYVYIASQIDTTDTQIMSFFKFIHEVEIVRDIPVRKWIKDGLFEKDIIGWHVYTYAFKRGKKGIEKTLIKEWFKPKFSMEFNRFNSLNQAHIFANLPKDKMNIRKVG